jgi:hypothetical protein
MAVVLLATLSGPAAPRLKDTSESSYFPTAVGTRWFYKVGDFEVTDVVTAVKKEDAVTTVTVQREAEDGKMSPSLKVEIRGDGLFMTEEAGLSYDPPACLLKFPVRAGDKWTTETRRPDGYQVSFHSKVIGVDDIDTPVGKHRCVRVHVEPVFENGGQGQPSVHVFAPGVGPVQFGDRTLRSFTPGKRQ